MKYHTGLFARLTTQQQQAALNYRGDENHGDVCLVRGRRGAIITWLVLCAWIGVAIGKEWDQTASPEDRAWFVRQMQPDFPEASCCGEADAYFADEFEIKDGKVYAIITDTRVVPGAASAALFHGTRTATRCLHGIDQRFDVTNAAHRVSMNSNTTVTV